MLEIVKIIPFVLPALAMVNMVIIKIAEMTKSAFWLSLYFNPQTPLYFNYWFAYLIFAVLSAAILGVMKKYTVRRAVLAVGCNAAVGAIMVAFAANRM